MPRQRRKKALKKSHWSITGKKLLSGLSLLLLVVFLLYGFYLNYLINKRFEGETWAKPSRVYARPLELYAGLALSLQDIRFELEQARYQRVYRHPQAGQYRIEKDKIQIHSKAFQFAQQLEVEHLIRLSFMNGSISNIVDIKSNQGLDLIRLPPALIGSYLPQNGEDRLVLDYDEIPQDLIKILLAIEDRAFYQHFGVSPVAIGRALISNIKAGKTVQGGSTLTQQLAKNLFLNPERSLWRKVNEAMMALLLELRFTKQIILAAYVNEVFLLQQNNVSIHGFALASRMLFRQELTALSKDKMALLVGMVKGPSVYNPLQNPESAAKRRNLVLKVMQTQGLISQSNLKDLANKPLGVVKKLPGVNRFPAYLDLVKKQLRLFYSDTDLSNKGLRIFTAFDPVIQHKLEQGLKQGLGRFKNNNLQVAVVMVDYLNGDIQALIGDRQVKYPGFNRAILAQRPIGSLIKPLLLYSVLDQNLSLASAAKDRPIRIRQSNGDIWAPQNYDRKLHGEMTIFQAFIKSYNLPFVHLGVNGGLKNLAGNLQKINLLKSSTIYPSLLLGTSPMSAFEATQLFQVVANSGYFSPLTTIRQVLNNEDQLLERVPIQSSKIFDKNKMIQVQTAMIGVTKQGTARYLADQFDGITLAGKTGTTNDLRDSWFAGFSQRRLAVVWLGHDDNSPINLTGSSGALKVWSDIMKNMSLNSFQPGVDPDLEWHSVNRFDGLLSDENCKNSVMLPFSEDNVPKQTSSECEKNYLGKGLNWLKQLF